IAAWNGPIDLERVAEGCAPSVRIVDHRMFGTWSAWSAEELLQHLRLHLDLAPDFAGRYQDLMALDADTLVVCIDFVGTARDSGGPFENHVCSLYKFGSDGRLAVIEVFEAEQKAEALARFDALATGGAEVEEPIAHVAPWSGRSLPPASKANAA